MSSKSVDTEEYKPIDIKKMNKTLRKRGGELVPSNGSLRVNTDIEVTHVKENLTFSQFVKSMQLQEEAKTADELNMGDTVEITGEVNHKGEFGIITHFSTDKRFVVVEIDGEEYSFHSSDVSESDQVIEDQDNRVRTAPKEFAIAAYNNSTRQAWVGVVTRLAGGKWHEQGGFGKEDKRWGQTYSASLSADDVFDEICRSFPRQVEIDGPFDTAMEALDHARREWGIKDEDKKPVEETEEAKPAQAAFVPGEKVHLGFGAKGGAGFKGTLKKVDDKEAEIESDTVDRFGKKTYKGPSRFLSKEVEEASEETVTAPEKSHSFKSHVESEQILDKVKLAAKELLNGSFVIVDQLTPSKLIHSKEVKHKFVDSTNGHWVLQLRDYRGSRFVAAFPPKGSSSKELVFEPNDESFEVEQ